LHSRHAGAEAHRAAVGCGGRDCVSGLPRRTLGPPCEHSRRPGVKALGGDSCPGEFTHRRRRRLKRSNFQEPEQETTEETEKQALCSLCLLLFSSCLFLISKSALASPGGFGARPEITQQQESCPSFGQALMDHSRNRCGRIYW